MRRAGPLVALVLAAAMAPVAALAQASPGWTTPSVIDTVIPTENGLIIILPGSNNPMQCASNTWAYIGMADPNYPLISSVLLTAFSQGKPVRTWQNSCDPDGRARFVAVWADRL